MLLNLRLASGQESPFCFEIKRWLFSKSLTNNPLHKTTFQNRKHSSNIDPTKNTHRFYITSKCLFKSKPSSKLLSNYNLSFYEINRMIVLKDVLRIKENLAQLLMIMPFCYSLGEKKCEGLACIIIKFSECNNEGEFVWVLFNE